MRLGTKKLVQCLVAAALFLPGGTLRATSASGRAGVAALVNNQYDAAEEALRRAIAEEPKNPLWHLNLGWTYLAQGKAKRALEAFDQAAALIPPSDFAATGWALWGKALAHERLGQCVEMGKALTEWMTQAMKRRFSPEAQKIVEGQIQIAKEKIRTCPTRAAARK